MWIAPSTFADEGDRAYVHAQPSTPAQERRALMALVACPVAAIQTDDKSGIRAAVDAFPDLIAGGVYHCGYHSEDSFGAASYLIQRTGGRNVLVDSPRFAGPLVRRIEALGGIQTIFLTHRDDVADFAKFRDHFGAKVVIHARDASGETRGADVLVQGTDAHRLDDELVVIPVPGHTAGSACLIYKNTFLFSGDHLAYDEALGHPYAFRNACWYDWSEQIVSMERLAQYEFEHILPGHGHPGHVERARVKEEMARCIEWMKGKGRSRR
jgi:glyoxylase-like metal-dependent hydrolase (beta-lactamase superfamily II)